MLIVFPLGKPAPHKRRNSQCRKYLSAHSRRIDMHRIAGTGQFKTYLLIAAEVEKTMRVSHIVADVWSGDARSGPMGSDKIIAQDNQMIGIGKRKRTQQNSLDDRKDGSRRANSECQHKNCRERKSWGFTQLAQGVSNVHHSSGQPLVGSFIAVQLLHLLHSSVCE